MSLWSADKTNSTLNSCWWLNPLSYSCTLAVHGGLSHLSMFIQRQTALHRARSTPRSWAIFRKFRHMLTSGSWPVQPQSTVLAVVKAFLQCVWGVVFSSNSRLARSCQPLEHMSCIKEQMAPSVCDWSHESLSCLSHTRRLIKTSHLLHRFSFMFTKAGNFPTRIDKSSQREQFPLKKKTKKQMNWLSEWWMKRQLAVTASFSCLVWLGSADARGDESAAHKWPV